MFRLLEPSNSLQAKIADLEILIRMDRAEAYENTIGMNLIKLECNHVVVKVWSYLASIEN